MNKIIIYLLMVSFCFAQDVPANILSDLESYLSKRDAQNLIESKTLGEEESKKYYAGKRALTNAGRLYKEIVPSVVLILNETVTGLGSGSFIDGDGHVITNYHVIDGAHPDNGIFIVPHQNDLGDIASIDWDNDVYSAKVIGTLKEKDLALLKIEGYSRRNIKPIKLGNHYTVNVADDVFAVGHPGSFLWSYASGTISKISNYTWFYSEDFKIKANTIFTQTPSNPGNSGGPLVNGDAEMIGINSAGDPNMANWYLAVRIDEVKSFISNAKKGRTSKDTEYIYEGMSKKEIDNLEFLMSLLDELDWEGHEHDDGTYYYYAEYEHKGSTIVVRIADEDDDGMPDSYGFDTNGDYQIDIVVVDIDENFTYNYWILDTNFDGKPDKEGYIDDIL